ncbi:unnamed protein product, partial [Urochloa humidicola]
KKIWWRRYANFNPCIPSVTERRVGTPRSDGFRRIWLPRLETLGSCDLHGRGSAPSSVSRLPHSTTSQISVQLRAETTTERLRDPRHKSSPPPSSASCRRLHHSPSPLPIASPHLLPPRTPPAALHPVRGSEHVRQACCRRQKSRRLLAWCVCHRWYMNRVMFDGPGPFTSKMEIFLQTGAGANNTQATTQYTQETGSQGLVEKLQLMSFFCLSFLFLFYIDMYNCFFSTACLPLHKWKIDR